MRSQSSARRFTHIAGTALFLALTTGCGASNAPSRPAVVFPTRAEIALLPSQKPPAAAFGASDAVSDTWTVEEAPAKTASYDDSSPVGELAREVQSQHGLTVSLSAPLRCASRELARFYLQHRAFPNDSLRRFIVSRCGGDAAMASPVAWFIDAPPSMAEKEIVARGRAELIDYLAKQLGAGGAHDLGIGIARDQKRAVIIGLVARKDVELEAGPRSVDGQRRITLRGVAHRDVATITGLVNRGEFGVARCQENLRVVAPKFELTCELAPGDPWAWVEIAGRKKGEMLEGGLADVLIYEGDGTNVTYAPRSFGPPAPVSSADDLTRGILGGLNAVRARAKMAPLSLAAKQSEENTRLAGTLFDAGLRGDSKTVNRAAIGLLAGWDVAGGIIRDGYFYLGAAAPTRDATAWLDAAIEQPIGRMALLNPEVRQIAIGPAIPADAAALGAAITTYALYESDDHSAEEAQFMSKVIAARANRGLPKPVRVGGFEDMNVQSKEVRLAGKAPMAALQDLLQAAVDRSGATVRGLVIETTDPAHVDVPGDLLTDGPLNMLVTVTHHRAPDAAWGQYVIFVLVVDGAATTPRTSASLPSFVRAE
jgi:hypothetical protein